MFQIQNNQTHTHDMLIDEDPLGQVEFVHIFKVVMIYLHVIMIKPEIKLTILAARLCWSWSCYRANVKLLTLNKLGFLQIGMIGGRGGFCTPPLKI